MKRDFRYLRDWIITLAVTSVAWSFFGTMFIYLLIKLLVKDQASQALTFYIVGTAVFCAVLGIKMFRLGIDINGRSTPVSADSMVVQQIIGVVLYVAVYLITGCNYVAGPVSHEMITYLWGNGVDMTFYSDISVSQHLSVFIPQALLYGGVSIGAYLAAKYRQDKKNVVVTKLREEKRAEEPANKELDIEEVMKRIR
ncbi:MAG: hypothetical protein IJ499_05385 [Clostridia bacterium]|nr:hypothetical protein [Clostridia bacterium]